MKAQPIRSQLLFSSFIFANEVVFSRSLLPFPAAIVIPSEFGPYCITLTSDKSVVSWDDNTAALFTVKSSTDRVICSTNLIVRRRG